jgi:hypothetical protein
MACTSNRSRREKRHESVGCAVVVDVFDVYHGMEAQGRVRSIVDVLLASDASGVERGCIVCTEM